MSVDIASEVTFDGVTVEATYNEDLDQDGVSENQHQTTLSNGLNVERISGLDGGTGNDYWIRFDFTSNESPVTADLKSGYIETEPQSDVPTAFLGEVTGDQIAIAWPDVGADEYTVHMSQAPGFTPDDNNEIDIISSSPFNTTATGLEDGERHYFKVVPVTNGESGEASNEVSRVTHIPQVTNVALNTDEGAGELSWDKQDDSPDGKIEILRSTDGSIGDVIAELSTDRESYTDNTVDEGIEYNYTIRRETDHSSADSEQVSGNINIAPPSNITVVINEDGTTSVEWIDNSEIETGFTVHESIDGGSSFGDISGELPENTETYNLGELDDDRLRVYYVEVFNSDYSATSNSIYFVQNGFGGDNNINRVESMGGSEPPEAATSGDAPDMTQKISGYIPTSDIDAASSAEPGLVTESGQPFKKSSSYKTTLDYPFSYSLDEESNWPVTIDFDLFFDIDDPSMLSDIGVYSNTDCTSSVTIKNISYDSETGSINVQIGLTVSCPEGKDSTDGSVSVNSPSGPSNSISNPDISTSNPNVNTDTPSYSNYPFNYYYPNYMNIGGACIPEMDTGTVNLSLMRLGGIQSYNSIITYNSDKLELIDVYGNDSENQDTFADPTYEKVFEGRVIVEADNGSSFNPYGAGTSNVVAKLEFRYVGDSGTSDEIGFIESGSDFFNSNGENVGPRNHGSGRVTGASGVNIIGDSVMLGDSFSVPVHMRTGESVESYDITITWPNEIASFEGVEGVDLDDPEHKILTEGGMNIKSSTNSPVEDPHICNIELEAIDPLAEPGFEGGAANMEYIEGSAIADNGTEIFIECNNGGYVTVNSPIDNDVEEENEKINIDKNAVGDYPINLSRTFVIEGLDTETLKDFSISIESETNDIDYKTNWKEIEPGGEYGMIASNVTITIYENEELTGTIELDVSVDFKWENNFSTSSGLIISGGVQYGGSGGLLTGIVQNQMGSEGGNFNDGFIL